MYTPTNISKTTLAPVIIFFHGGGFYFGSICKLFILILKDLLIIYLNLDSHDTMNYHMSKYTGAKVIAVKYVSI